MASLRDTLNNLARDYAIAWSSGDPDAVAAFFTQDAQVTVNQDEPMLGQSGVKQLAKTMFQDFPELDIRCDMMRWVGSHALFVWTLEGRHSGSGNLIITRGWEQWELDPDYKIKSSHSWFDTEDHQRQIDVA